MAINAAAKGKRYEQKIARILRENGIPCGRVPKSGALRKFDESLKDDLKAELPSGREIRIECKKKASRPPLYIYEDLGDSDMLIVARDGMDDLVIMLRTEWIKQVGGE